MALLNGPLLKHVLVCYISFLILINVLELQLHLDVQNLKPPEGFDSDSDSGQGSCKMGSPVQMSNGVASLDDGGRYFLLNQGLELY